MADFGRWPKIDNLKIVYFTQILRNVDMNILTHPVHTGYQYDLAKTGHEFFSLQTPDSSEVFWDYNSRPKQKNYHHLKSLEEGPKHFDLILVHYDAGYHQFKNLNLPIIFKEHCLREVFVVPSDWLSRITYYSFASPLAAAAWKVPEELEYKKMVIGMRVDLNAYRGSKGKKRGILAVGQNVESRGREKGYSNLIELAIKMPMTIVGRGNESIPGSVGPAANYKELCGYYKSHEVFFNPSNVLVLATLEAMAVGMPVVSFRTVNSDIICDRENGLLVDNLEEAEAALKRLLTDKPFAEKLGRSARATIKQRYPEGLFAQRWNALFREAVYDFYPSIDATLWKRFDIETKPAAERTLALMVSRTTFEYERVGVDKRKMTFLPNGRIGAGSAGCEVLWDLKIETGGIFLEISSGQSVTCRLKRSEDDTWTGSWLVHEKMPVILRPLAS